MSRNLFSWLVYDAANSFTQVAIGGLFLAQWIILDKGFDDLWYGGIFALATIFVLLTSPFCGAWSDKIGKRLPFVKWFTVFLIIFSGLIAIVAPSVLPDRTRVLIVLAIALVIQYLYQLSMVFYNALLEKVSTMQTRGKISGLGEAFNNFTWILASGILLMFANKKITIFGEPGRAQVFLPSFILSMLLFLPMIFWFKETTIPKSISKRLDLREIYQKTVRGFKDLFSKNKNVGIFLVAFSFVADGLQTIQLYFAIIMDRLYKIDDTQKYYVLTLMFVFVVIGDYILGRISDRRGTKVILVLSCIDLVVIFAFALLSSRLEVLYLLAFLGGIGWGGFYATSRAMLIKISPSLQLGEYFGFYSTFQRFASVTGPVLWGITTLILREYGDAKYRVAGLMLVFLMIAGVFMLKYVKEEKVLT